MNEFTDEVGNYVNYRQYGDAAFAQQLRYQAGLNGMTGAQRVLQNHPQAYSPWVIVFIFFMHVLLFFYIAWLSNAMHALFYMQ